MKTAYPPPPTLSIDLRGRANPEPVLELARYADSLLPGETIEALTDDACSVNDFLRWCALNDFEMIEVHYQPEGVNRFLLKRAA